MLEFAEQLRVAKGLPERLRVARLQPSLSCMSWLVSLGSREQMNTSAETIKKIAESLDEAYDKPLSAFLQVEKEKNGIARGQYWSLEEHALFKRRVLKGIYLLELDNNKDNGLVSRLLKTDLQDVSEEDKNTCFIALDLYCHFIISQSPDMRVYSDLKLGTAQAIQASIAKNRGETNQNTWWSLMPSWR